MLSPKAATALNIQGDFIFFLFAIAGFLFLVESAGGAIASTFFCDSVTSLTVSIDGIFTTIVCGGALFFAISLKFFISFLPSDLFFNLLIFLSSSALGNTGALTIIFILLCVLIIFCTDETMALSCSFNCTAVFFLILSTLLKSADLSSCFSFVAFCKSLFSIFISGFAILPASVIFFWEDEFINVTSPPDIIKPAIKKQKKIMRLLLLSFCNCSFTCGHTFSEGLKRRPSNCFCMLFLKSSFFITYFFGTAVIFYQPFA